MITRRPVPIALKVRDLIDGERLSMECPSCRQRIGQQCYSVRLELPPDYLVTRYVTRHWCRDCSKGGEKVRAIGWIEGRAAVWCRGWERSEQDAYFFRVRPFGLKLSKYACALASATIASLTWRTYFRRSARFMASHSG
jgi:hypothetical protein